MQKTTKNAMIHTSYLDSLAGDIRERYNKKTARIQIDPYQFPAEAFSDDRTKWPEVSYVDVVHFLIFQESAYTKDQLKNYKSLDAYKLFQDGWIKEILHKEINGVHLLRAKVTHSMRVNEKPLESWVIVGTDGSVESAHCTCMAGLGECCTHIAAVLFALETGARIRKEATVMNVPAYWMFPSTTKLYTPYKRLKDMDLQSVAKKRKLSNNETVPTPKNTTNRHCNGSI